ncbi:MAG TPA: metallophosphoesterase [Solirubrobacteraceae bacterium]|jgi:hypothetical protein
MPRPSALLLLTATLAAVLAVAAPDAGAAFAGRNGELVHEGSSSKRGVVYLRSAGGTTSRRLRFPAPVLDPAFSPQGKRLAFASRGDLWTMYGDGEQRRQLTVGADRDADPAWSAAGDAIVFVRGPKGNRDLLRVRTDVSGTVERVTAAPQDEWAPAVSSTDRVAFVREDADGRGDLWLVGGAPGTPERHLTSGRKIDDDAPAWSPDGAQIAFTRRKRGKKEVAQVYVMRADGGGLRRLTKLRRNGATSPVWSPDGKRIAYAAGSKKRRRIYVMRTSGKGVRGLTPAKTDARKPDWQSTGADPMVVAVGDIACGPDDIDYAGGLGTADRCHQRYTSDALYPMELSGILMLGDMQYENARSDRIAASYDPTWGRFRNITWPIPGNHEFREPNAQGYFDYWNGPGVETGRAGTRPFGYYSFDIGRWHVVALNSQCAHEADEFFSAACSVGSPQERWLRQDLATNSKPCTLAFWHHPLFSSGFEGPSEAVRPLYRALYDAGGDLILNGHDHGYERFAPQNPDGQPDPQTGVREFISGAGGHSHQRGNAPKPNSEARNVVDYGVLQLVLRPTSYDWRFVTEAGAVTDAGTGNCH